MNEPDDDLVVTCVPCGRVYHGYGGDQIAVLLKFEGNEVAMCSSCFIYFGTFAIQLASVDDLERALANKRDNNSLFGYVGADE